MQETSNLALRKKVTGQLFFKRTGESTYVDLGNVRMHKIEPNIDRTKYAVAQKGYVQIVHEQPAQVETRWTVGLDVETYDFERLALLAGAGTKATVSSATGGSESFTSVKIGQVICLAKVDVSTVVVQVSSSTKTAGTDYSLDAKSGRITILRNGTIVDGDTVDVTYNNAQFKKITYTDLGELLVAGSVMFDEFDIYAETPRSRFTFAAQLIVSNRGDNDGKKASEFEVQLLATGTITKIRRDDT